MENLKHVCEESEFNPLADDICPACIYENAKRLGYLKQAENKIIDKVEKILKDNSHASTYFDYIAPCALDEVIGLSNN